MIDTDRRAWQRYGGAFLATVIAIALRYLAEEQLGLRVPIGIYYVAVLFSAWFGGFGPTLLVTICLVGVPPALNPVVRAMLWPPSQVTLAIFSQFLIGLMIAGLGGWGHSLFRKARREAEGQRRARLEVESGLNELSRAAAEREELLVRQTRLLEDEIDRSATLSHLFNQVPVGLALIDEELRPVRVNATAARFLGIEDPGAARQGAYPRLDEMPVAALLGAELRDRLESTLSTGPPIEGGVDPLEIESHGETRHWDWRIERVERPAGGRAIGLVLTAVDVTDRVRREQSNREIEARLRITLGSIGDAVVSTDREGRIEYMNPVAERLSGWTLSEAEGRSALEVVPISDESNGFDLHSLSASSIAETEPDRRSSQSARLKTRGGASVAVDVVAAPIRSPSDMGASGWVLVFRDERQRREIHEALLASEQNLRELADTMPQSVWRSRADGTIDYYNARFRDYVGGKDDDFETGNSWPRFIHPEDAARFLPARATALVEGRRVDAKVRLLGTDGSYRWHLIRSVPIIDADGKVLRRYGTATDIEDLVRAQEALRVSEARFREMAELIPQIIWVTNTEMSMTYLNRRWYEYTGLSVEESLDRTKRLGLVHPDDAQEVRAGLVCSQTNGEPFDVEFRLRDASGNYRWFLGRSIPVFDDQGRIVSRVGTSTDIDDRKRLEGEARFLAHASTMLANLDDVESKLISVARLAVPFLADWCSIDLVDRPGSIRRIVLTSSRDDDRDLGIADPERTVVRQGYPPKPASGEAARLLDSGEALLAADLDSSRVECFAWDDEHRAEIAALGVESMISVPLKGWTGSIGLLTFATRRGRRRLGERERLLASDLAQRMAVAIENARLYEDLRLASERKSQFLAVLAHELRNPLSPIRNALYLLTEADVDPSERRATAAMMRRQVTHLERMVDDLMDMARIDQDKVALRREPVEVADLFARSVETALPEMDERGHLLEVSLPEKPLTILADASRICQVIGNLLDNASKYTDPGGRIRLSAREVEGMVEIVCRDNGIGMTGETIDQIFDMFVQGERRLDRARGGIGVGLSLVRGLTEIHGGTVEARSAGLGKGSEFVVRLPLLVEDARAASAVAPNRIAESTPSPPKLRVLVVDDNVDGARTMSLLLRRLWEQEVETAFDGPTALTAVEQFHPDVVLLDIGLPGMDGYEVARRIKASPRGDSTILVAVTGWGQEEDRRKSRESGFLSHLVKPVDLEKLRVLLKEIDAASAARRPSE
ncbi:MAG: PAS domain S-box protein [Isosphaeraceae bacterium]|nr:PAS domain S-box protein [Isosphaeraceae bacterium]